MKKRSGRDSRQETSVEASEETATNFRVDRVFSNPPPPNPVNAGSRPPMSPSTASLMNSARNRRATGTGVVDAESELSLRRQLSRLQRQLADAQRDLANKDDELAAEVEKRANAVDAHDALLEEFKLHKAHLDELLSYRARTTAIEQRLQETVSAVDELSQQLEQEQSKAVTAAARCDELQAQFDEARSRWTAERLKLDGHYAAETSAIEASKRAAIDAAEATMATTIDRLRAAQEEELAQLRASHERSLAALRGELEPQALEARNLTEECERLTSELAARTAEVARVTAEMADSHQRDLTQLGEMHTSEKAALTQRHAAELARIAADRDEKSQAVDQATRFAEAREAHWEQTVGALREQQKRLQRDLAEARERIAAVEADSASMEERLVVASATAAQLGDDNEELLLRLHAAEADAKRNTLDHARFVAYLEEGLALLGASPPAERKP